MSTAAETIEVTAPTTGLRLAHIQHPGRPLYEAMCGAEVLGIVADRPATCLDCIARYGEWRTGNPPGSGGKLKASR